MKLGVSSWRYTLQMHGVVLIWGFTGVLGVLIHLPAVDLVLWRTLIATVGFAILVKLKGNFLVLRREEMIKLLSMGTLMGVHWVLFFLSARLSTVSICLAALPTTLLWTSILEPWMEKGKRLQWIEILTGVVMVLAVGIIYQVEWKYWLGFSVGILAALVAAIFTIMNKRMVERYSYDVLGFYTMGGAWLGTLFLVAMVEWEIRMPRVPERSLDWLLLIILSLLCTVFVLMLFMDCLKNLALFKINVIYNLEPVYGVLLARWILGGQEQMKVGFYIGALLILVCVGVQPWLQKKIDKEVGG
jgi:drug/metabolite transporter (DMT)-like permease